MLEALDRLRDGITTAVTDDADRADVLHRLRALVDELDAAAGATEAGEQDSSPESVSDRLQSASDDELFELFDSDFRLT